jgi:hypothetical protein
MQLKFSLAEKRKAFEVIEEAKENTKEIKNNCDSTFWIYCHSTSFWSF